MKKIIKMIIVRTGRHKVMTPYPTYRSHERIGDASGPIGELFVRDNQIVETPIHPGGPQNDAMYSSVD